MKVLIKFLSSIILSSLLTALFFGAENYGMFSNIEARFVSTAQLGRVDASLQAVESVYRNYQERFVERLQELVYKPAFRRSFALNQEAEDIRERSEDIRALERDFPAFVALRFVDSSFQQIHYSSVSADIQSQSANSLSYINAFESNVGIEQDEIQAETIENIGDVQIIAQSEMQVLSFVLPVFNDFDIFQGWAIANVNMSSLRTLFYSEARLPYTERVHIVQGSFFDSETENVAVILLNGPEELGEIARLLQESRIQQNDVLDIENIGSYVLRYRSLSSEAAPSEFSQSQVGFLYLIPRSELELSGILRVFLSLLVFFTSFLLVLLILNIRREPDLLVQDRVRKFQQEILKHIVNTKANIELAQWQQELRARKKHIIQRISRGLSPREVKQYSEFIESSWEDILSILSSYSKNENDRVGTSEALLERLISQLGRMSVQRVSADRAQAEQAVSTDSTEVKVEALEELEHAEALESIEALDDAEDLEDLEALESIGELEDVEDLESIEYLEDVEALESIGDLEDVEELESIEDAEEIESIAELENTEAEEFDRNYEFSDINSELPSVHEYNFEQEDSLEDAYDSKAATGHKEFTELDTEMGTETNEDSYNAELIPVEETLFTISPENYHFAFSAHEDIEELPRALDAETRSEEEEEEVSSLQSYDESEANAGAAAKNLVLSSIKNTEICDSLGVSIVEFEDGRVNIHDDILQKHTKKYNDLSEILNGIIQNPPIYRPRTQEDTSEEDRQFIDLLSNQKLDISDPTYYPSGKCKQYIIFHEEGVEYSHFEDSFLQEHGRELKALHYFCEQAQARSIALAIFSNNELKIENAIGFNTAKFDSLSSYDHALFEQIDCYHSVTQISADCLRENSVTFQNLIPGVKSLLVIPCSYHEERGILLLSFRRRIDNLLEFCTEMFSL